jgi:hypothetical protein
MSTSTSKQEVSPKKQVSYKFFLLCFVLAAYFFYLNVQYDVMTSGITALLTWSFFVLCTPIADAGFLLDFPLRLLFGIRMLVSEIAVWTVAIVANIVSLNYFSGYYETTELTRLLHTIMTTPYPYWSIVILSGIGTFLSIRFADELLDVVHHGERHFFHRHGYKHEIVIILFFIVVFFGYYKLLASLGVNVG